LIQIWEIDDAMESIDYLLLVSEECKPAYPGLFPTKE
jgi:hypothetical protein